MGARLASAALDPYWSDLSPVARIVLLKMAMTAKDNPTDEQPAGEYWAGHALLILTLRGDVPEPRTRERKAADTQIERAIRELRTKKAIAQVATAEGRTRARYRLTLAPELPVDNLRRLADRKRNSPTPDVGQHPTPGVGLFAE